MKCLTGVYGQSVVMTNGGKTERRRFCKINRMEDYHSKNKLQ